MWVTVIVAGVLLLGWVLLNLKTSRPDGTHIGRVHPYRKMMWYIMPTRNESVVYYDTFVRADNLLAYLAAANRRFHCDVTHTLVAAVGMGLLEAPKMNRFVSGRRLYQRKDRRVTFSMKRKKKDQEARLAAVKLRFEDHGDIDGETFEQLCARIGSHIDVQRSDAVTRDDKEFNLLTAIPRPLLNVGVRLFRWMDYHNVLPGSFIDGDAMYTSVFIANLGSIQMAPGFHHLYEWGNCPLFLMVGQIEDRAIIVDGRLEVHRVLPLRYTYDERIDDGLTSRRGIRAVGAVLADPARYLGCLTDDGSDHFRMGEERIPPEVLSVREGDGAPATPDALAASAAPPPPAPAPPPTPPSA